MVVRSGWAGKLRGGRKLVAPELLKFRAAPGGGVAALMVSAAWFGFGQKSEPDSRKVTSGDPDRHTEFQGSIIAGRIRLAYIAVPRGNAA